MPYEEFLNLQLVRDDYIVIIRLKYDHEKEWRQIVVIMEFDPTSEKHFWNTDWYEGEQHIEILSAVPLQIITPGMIGHRVVIA